MDLQLSFNKSVVGCRLRDILTQHGIPQNEAVTVKIEKPKGKDIVVSEVPKSNRTFFATNTSSDFRGDVIEFLNRSDAMFDLISELPSTGVSTTYQKNRVEQTETMYKITFECGKMESIMSDGELPSEMKESPLAIISVPFVVCKPCPPKRCCSK